MYSGDQERAQTGAGDPLNQLFLQRLRVGLRITLGAVFLFGLADLMIESSREVRPFLLACKAIGLTFIVLMFRVLRWPFVQRHATATALICIAAGCLSTAVSGITLGNDQTTRLIFTVMVMAAATLLPWGVWAQLATVVISATVLVWNVAMVNGSLAAVVSYPTGGVLLAMLTSVAVTHQLDRFRLVLAERDRERDRNEAALRASEANLRGIFDHLADVFYRTDLQGNVLMVSPSVERYGYRPSELIGTYITGLILSAAERQRILDVMLAQKAVSDFEVTLRRKDGTYVPMSSTARILFDQDGTPIGTEGMLRDISVRKQAESVLQASEQRFRALAHEAPAGIFTTDADGNCTFVNERWCEISGITAEQAAGVGWVQALHPDDRARVGAQWEAAVQGDGHFASTYRFRTPGGVVTWVNGSATRLRNEAGEITEYLGTIADITEHKRSEERLANLLELARDISGTLNLPELLDRAHQRILNILGCDSAATWYWDAGEQVSRLLSQRGMPAEAAAAVSSLRIPRGAGFGGKVTAGKTIVANHPDEYRQFPVGAALEQWGVAALVAVPMVVRGETLGTLVALSGEPGIFPPTQVQLLESIAHQLAVAIEATELHAAQQQEARIAGALARVGQTMISSLDRPVLLDRLCQLTTEVLSCDFSHTFLRQPDTDLYVPVASFGDRPEQWEALRTLEMPAPMIAKLIAKLELTGPVQVTAQLNQDLLPENLQAKYDIKLGMFIPLRRGDELIGIHSAGYRHRLDPFNREQVRIAAGLAQLASLAIENSRLVGELETAGRIKSDFVATMSHELRTPLAVVIGYSDLLLDGEFGELTQEQADTIRRMEEHAQGLLELVRTILDLSRLDSDRVSVQRESIDLRQFLGAITGETRTAGARPGLELRWHVDSDVPPIFTDATKLRVVLTNVIGNAIKFTEAGSVSVRARVEGDEVEIEVEDTGIGIASEALPTIFEPFQQGDGSINAHYGGAGLGLHIVRRLVDILGGKVSVESDLGRGSTFRICLPSNL